MLINFYNISVHFIAKKAKFAHAIKERDLQNARTLRNVTCKQFIVLLRLHFYYCVCIEKCIDIINTVVSYIIKSVSSVICCYMSF